MSVVQVARQRFEASVPGQRWLALPARDRLALLLLGAFVAAVVVYVWLWLPVQRQALAAREDYQQQRELNAYLHAHAPSLRGRESHPVAKIDPARLQGFVASSAVQQGLTVERLDSEGQGRVLVSLQSAAFSQLLAWLAEMEAQGVRVDEAGLDRAEMGRVSARFTLRAE